MNKKFSDVDNSNVFCLATAARTKETQRLDDLQIIMSQLLGDEILVDETGRIDVEFALPWQAQADAFGLDIRVSSLLPGQFKKLVEVLAIWGFIVLNRLGMGSDINRLEATPRNDYLKGVIAGKPRVVPVPNDLQSAVDEIIAMTETDMPPLPHGLRLVRKGQDY